jgi:hypothetical protein
MAGLIKRVPPTVTSQAAGTHALGASPQTVERVTDGVDLAQGLAGGIATGTVWRGLAATSTAKGLMPETQWLSPSELRFSQTTAGAVGEPRLCDREWPKTAGMASRSTLSVHLTASLRSITHARHWRRNWA